MNLLQLVYAAVFEGDQGRGADRRQRPRGLRAGAAERVGDRHMPGEPGRAFRPVDPHFTANATPGALLDQFTESARLARCRRHEERSEVMGEDAGIDAGAEAEQHEGSLIGDARYLPDEASIKTAPVRCRRHSSSLVVSAS